MRIKPIRPSVSISNLSESVYHFCDKTTGISVFQVAASEDGSLPLDYAAGVLAMQCLVRGQRPENYAILISAPDHQIKGLGEKAQKLLDAGHTVDTRIRLTRREEEVLGGVMGSLANKEIASKLNISERTVKFHVSALLAKFRVKTRMLLVRDALRQSPSPIVG